MRYCDDALRDEVNGYINAITETINNKKYTNALEQMKQAKTSNDFLIAAELFEEIKDYRDSDSLAKECWKKNEEIIQEEKERKEREQREQKRLDIVAMIILSVIFSIMVILFITSNIKGL